MDALWLTKEEEQILREAIALALMMCEHRPPRLPDFENPDKDARIESVCDRLRELERRLLWLQGEGTVPTKEGNKDA